MDRLQEMFNNLFANITHEEGQFLLICLAVAYLLGLWTGWLIWGRRAAKRLRMIRKLEGELNARNAEYQVLQNKEAQLQQVVESQKSELVVLEDEKAAIMTRLSSADRDKRTLNQQVVALQEENTNLKEDMETYLKKIDALDNQLISLQTKNKQLNEEIEKNADTLNDFASIQSSYNATRDRLVVIESKISDLSSENQNLRVELAKIKDQPIEENTSTATGLFQDLPKEEETTVVNDTTTSLEEEIEVELDPSEAQDKVRAAIGKTIPSATEADKDDLKQIKGIGSFIEDKLNDLGIYTYEQICKWDEEMIETVTAAIAFFPGRIKRDDWVGQACSRTKSKGDTKPKAKTVKSTGPKGDRLQIIEGIGPVGEKVLKEGGIHTFEQLAKSTTEQLKDILKASGKPFRLATPDTWIPQAKLALEGEWDELKDLQDRLQRGRVD